MDPEILKVVRERGLLLEKSLFDVLEDTNDVALARNFLDALEKVSGQKVITSTVLNKKAGYVGEFVKELQGEVKGLVEKTFVNLGISLEIKKEIGLSEKVNKEENEGEIGYKIFYSDSKLDKKVEVKDFVSHFRARYQQLQGILMSRMDVENLVAIDKIARGERTSFSVIGAVCNKRKTANNNLIIELEDPTGRVSALVKHDGDCFKKGEELQLDDIVAVRASGNRDLVFVHDIIFPDIFKEKTKFDEDVWIAFASDVHAGSKKHLGKEFNRFIEWLNSGDAVAKKIKFLFFVGDNVDGVGVFPGQERLLELTSLREQYELLASYLKRIPKGITMFMCPGQHDSVRVPEPQPIIDSHYGGALHEIPNLVLVSNPTTVKLHKADKEFNVLMYHGASIHSFINEIEELRLMKAHQCPAKAVKHMLKRRHLAPSHSSVVYVPNNVKDPLVIEEAPDVLCTGEVHRLDIENYNGVLIITGSCWQAQTDFEEKVGNVPDPCKVPILNLKTRELRILDFSDETEEGKNEN